MRKTIGLLVGLIVLGVAGTALAGPAATDPAGEFLVFGVKVSPPASGTRAIPRAVGITIDAFGGNRINGNADATSTGLTVLFHNNFTENGLKFPGCTINTKTITQCPKAAKVGSGTGEGELLNPTHGAPTYIPAQITAYNGKPLSGKNSTLIFIASVGGKPAGELDFSVEHRGGGLAFHQLVFPSATASPINITKFDVTIPARTEHLKVRGHRRTVNLIDAPTSCHKAWTFSDTLTFATLAPLTATNSQPCVIG